VLQRSNENDFASSFFNGWSWHNTMIAFRGGHAFRDDMNRYELKYPQVITAGISQTAA
jgi:hypothetical protein